MKIKLMDIIDALEMSDVENKSYYNKKTGEILWSMDNNLDNSTYTEEDEFNDDIIYMFGFNSVNDYRIMKMFIQTIEDIKISNDLYNRIQGSGAFSRFKEYVIKYEIEENWYRFRDNQLKNIAIDWCKENNIDYYE